MPLVLVAFLGPALSAWSSEPARTAEQMEFVEKRVRPILVENCLDCHGAKKQSNKLRLDNRATILKGGHSGPAIVVGGPDNSLIIQAVRRHGELQMPPKKALSPQEVANLVAWVKMGAPWPESTVAAQAPDSAKHWAFQPILNPPLPKVRDASWPRSAPDYFVLSKLEEKSLTPSPPANKLTLIRRVTFDLTGDRKSTRLNSSHIPLSRMPSS